MTLEQIFSTKSQTQIAIDTGLTQPTISKWLTGVGKIGAKGARALQRAYKIPLEESLSWTPNKNGHP